jgi:hypothetical protein
MASAEVRVFEILYHVSDDHPSAHGGPAGDGSFVMRFRRATVQAVQALACAGRGHVSEPAPYTKLDLEPAGSRYPAGWTENAGYEWCALCQGATRMQDPSGRWVHAECFSREDFLERGRKHRERLSRDRAFRIQQLETALGALEGATDSYTPKQVENDDQARRLCEALALVSDVRAELRREKAKESL